MATFKKVMTFVLLGILLLNALLTLILRTPVSWYIGGALWLYMFMSQLYLCIESKDSID